MTLMSHSHPPDAGGFIPCPQICVQPGLICDMVPQILWRRGEMVGDRSRQLPRMPLPDLVRGLISVRCNKLGWLAGTLPIVGNVDGMAEK